MNPRIPEIVKILANLIQELDNAQENRESLEVLGRIKLYSAQLYLETDMEIIALNRDDLDEEVEFEDDEFSTNAIPSPEKTKNINEIPKSIEPIEFNTPEEEEIEVEFYPMEEPSETEEFEIEFMDDEEKQESSENETRIEFEDVDDHEEDDDEDNDEDDDEDDDEDNDDHEEEDDDNNGLEELEDESPGVNNNQVNEDENDIIEFSINQQPEIRSSDFIPTPNNLGNENSAVNDLQNSQQEKPRQPELFNHSGDLEAHKAKAQEILGMFSLSRRFEFANLLFAGDMQQFILFLCEVLAAPNSDAREDVIDDWYEKNQWRRKDETASDLKRNLRKML